MEQQPEMMLSRASNPDAKLDLWLLLLPLGLALAALGGFVFYETFQIFAEGTSAWFQCVGQQGALFAGCGQDLTLAYDYRFGVGALPALVLSLMALFAGPIPLIAVLRRFEHPIISGVLFLLVVIPYSMIAFLALMLMVLVVLFYLMRLVS